MGDGRGAGNIHGRFRRNHPIPNAFHNLKTAIKETPTDKHRDDFFYENTVPSREELREIIKSKDLDVFRKIWKKRQRMPNETLMHTNDGQLCDVIIDKACLEAILEAAESADDVIAAYARTVVAVADIKIAVRCQKNEKSPMTL